MIQVAQKRFSWDFFAALFIAIYAALAFSRWPLLPQFIDIYYHLHTAWGFLLAGGYSGWDFWQYAPFGRAHIYPPLFHLILALALKLGCGKVFLAKVFEAGTPVIFLATVWYFLRRNFGKRLAFFAILAFGSSFSFFLSLFNNIPATLAFCFGLLSIDCFLRGRLLRSALLLALAFYTHIGAPWVFALCLILFGSFDKEKRKAAIGIVLTAIFIALPVLLKELAALKSIQLTDMPDRYFCEFKVLDYALALSGLIIAFRRKGNYLLFVSLFLASFIFILYPYRFFSAQGYLPVIFFSAIFLDTLYDRVKENAGKVFLFFALAGFLILIFSPTILTEKKGEAQRAKFYSFDSVPRDMLFPFANERIASTSLWNPEEYIWTARLIRKNSQPNEIIYANYHILSACLATLSGRANASALLPEIDPVKRFSPFKVATIIVLTKDNSLSAIKYVVAKYKLRFLGENKFLLVFSNPTANARLVIPKAGLPFWAIILFFIICCFIFALERKIMSQDFIKKYLT